MPEDLFSCVWRVSPFYCTPFSPSVVRTAISQTLVAILRPHVNEGQRIVAKLRRRMYGAALRQEVEFVERGEGDVLSRLGADSSIVGERCVVFAFLFNP